MKVDFQILDINKKHITSILCDGKNYTEIMNVIFNWVNSYNFINEDNKAYYVDAENIFPEPMAISDLIDVLDRMNKRKEGDQ